MTSRHRYPGVAGGLPPTGHERNKTDGQQTNTGSLTQLPITFPLSWHAMTTWVIPFSGLNGQPRETTQHVPGPIWATFGLLIQKQYVTPLFVWQTVQIAPLFLHWNAYIFLFCLNPMVHSKFHNTLNTLRLLPTSVGLLALPCTRQCRRSPPPHPSPLFYFLSRTEEPAKVAATCANDRRAIQQLALNVQLITHS